MPTLYLIRGVPGSGKSTFAKELYVKLNYGLRDAVVHAEADNYMTDGFGNYVYDPNSLPYAHGRCQWLAEEGLKTNRDVIVSNTSTTEKEVKVYKYLADKYNATFVSLIVENRHGGVNQHGVPEEKIQQMKQRFSIKL